MITQQLNRNEPEKVFVIAKNISGFPDIFVGECVLWGINAEPVGLMILQSQSLGQGGVAGIAVQDIPAGAFGLIQVYGVHRSVKTTVAAMATTADVVADANGTVVIRTTEDASRVLGWSIKTGANNRGFVFIQKM